MKKKCCLDYHTYYDLNLLDFTSSTQFGNSRLTAVPVVSITWHKNSGKNGSLLAIVSGLGVLDNLCIFQITSQKP